MSETKEVKPIEPHVKIPADMAAAIIRIAWYTLVMWLLLLPSFSGWQHFCNAGILGLIVSQLNRIGRAEK